MPYQKWGKGMWNGENYFLKKTMFTKEAIQVCNTLNPILNTDSDTDTDDDFSDDDFTDAD